MSVIMKKIYIGMVLQDMNLAVILAGGQGLRMGGLTPKQFLTIENKPILLHTLEAFERHPLIDKICVVCLPAWQDTLRGHLEQCGIRKVSWIIGGGACRRESSYLAVKLLYRECDPEDVVLIHDGARPMVSARILTENIESARKYGACETVSPAQDTIVISEDGETVHFLPDRRTVYHVQTPQSFLLREIYGAHQYYLARQGEEEIPDITDDGGLLLYAGKKVAMVLGEKQNLKLTSREDLIFFQTVLANKNR